jgi:hypothetical protein
VLVLLLEGGGQLLLGSEGPLLVLELEGQFGEQLLVAGDVLLVGHEQVLELLDALLAVGAVEGGEVGQDLAPPLHTTVK